jgi:hypothetical protein
VAGQQLVPVSENAFAAGASRVEFANGAARLRRITSDGDTTEYVRVAEWSPTTAELQQFAGEYTSAEAEVTLRIAVQNGRLVRIDRYGETARLTPSYTDAFWQGGVLATFHRDTAGRVVGMSLGLGRVRDLRFERQ